MPLQHISEKKTAPCEESRPIMVYRILLQFFKSVKKLLYCFLEVVDYGI